MSMLLTGGKRKAVVNKRESDDVGEAGARANKGHLSDAMWVACCLTNTNKSGGCAAEQTLYTCYNAQVWKL